MTATQTPPRPQTRPKPTKQIHWVTLGGTRMYCLQRDCDGIHHVFCSCHAR